MKFSLVITCYNQRDFIGAAVDSALSQQHRPGEIIVVDDGSTDGSLEMVQRFGASIKLVRFSRNIGAIEARNEGAARAEGEYVVFLDGDDLFVPWAFDVYHTIVEQRDPKIVVSARQWFQGASPLLTKSGLPSSVEFIEYTNLLAKDRGATGGLGASGLIVHRQALQNVGGWSRGIFHLDVIDFTLKLGYSGRTVLVCSPRTVLYRFHTANSILTVPPFLRMAHRIMEREKAGEYPGGKEHRFERYAYLGGVIAFWASNAMRARFYVDALRLAVLGSPMILAAIVHKLSARASHRHAVVTVNLPLDSNKTGLPRAARRRRASG